MKLIPHNGRAFGGFNSMIVRLKAPFTGVKPAAYGRFNSMIVRLKEKYYIDVFEVDITFQFYDSPIKRYTRCRGQRNQKWFQFYDSPIKRRLNRTIVAVHRGFQFYDSPIKSILRVERPRQR